MRLVSVIVPSFNSDKYIRDCVRSVQTQSLQDFEIIVVNDGSTDQSTPIVEDMALRDQRIVCLAHPDGKNLGVSKSRKLAIARASGKYIAFLDSDDAFMPCKLERQCAMLDQNQNAVLCHTAIDVIGDPTLKIQFEESFNFSRVLTSYTYHTRPDALKRNIICNSSVVTRSEPLKKALVSFPQMFQTEDWINWLRISRFGDFIFTPERLTAYRLHANSATGRILQDRLAAKYSRLEFLLSCICFAEDEPLRQNAERELTESVSDLLAIYSQNSPVRENLLRDAVDSEEGCRFIKSILRDELQLLRRELETAKSSERQLRNSRSYRLGQTLLKPGKWLQRILDR